MKITPNMKLDDLIKQYPFLEEFFIELKPEFGLLKNKAFRMTMGKIATLEKVSNIGEIPIDELISKIEKRIYEEGSKTNKKKVSSSREKIDKLKGIIKKLHNNENFNEAKKQFDELIKEIEPGEIVKMEEALIGEGMPISEVQRLCSVHHAVVSEGLVSSNPVDTPEGHPVNTYIKENKQITRLAEELSGLAFKLDKIKSDIDKESILSQIKKTLENLSKIEFHYRRKEYQLFPYLEKVGFTGPSQVMWAVHDEIRAKIKKIQLLLSENQSEELNSVAISVARDIMEMIAKEESILFPMALEKLGDSEWAEIRKGEDSIGYFLDVHPADWPADKAGITPNKNEMASSDDANRKKGELSLNTGFLSIEQLDSILTTLPIDLSFVDENDNVRYYTEGKERIFPRSPGVIGRNVEKCHPPKSVHIVKRILDEFKAGKKESAEFWIQMGGKFLHIRYFPVRNKDGKYLGTLEFSQDITEIRKLEGERRLLNWEKSG